MSSRICLVNKYLVSRQDLNPPLPPSFITPNFVVSLEELLTKILLFAAEEAADKALGLAGSNPDTNTTTKTSAPSSAVDWFSEISVGAGGGMVDFRRKASRALRAARSVAEQRGLDVRFVESLIVRLSKGWINQPKAAGGGVGGAGGLEGGRGGLFGGVGGAGVGGAESVFTRDSREVGKCTTTSPFFCLFISEVSRKQGLLL